MAKPELGTADSFRGWARPTTAAELLRLPYAESLSLFRSLPAPELGEMDGEYRADLLDQGPPVFLWVASFFVHQRGLWLAKAFTPTGPSEGRGYNLFVVGDRLRRGTRMRTTIAPSRIDGRPAYLLDYSAYLRGILGTMRDEVRKVADGLYLGLGTVGYGRWMRRPSPFLLEGPVSPFDD
ncbi:MAG: hypothetical protein JRI23_36795 [Deltaproteobacteria bacterium]|jgi:hypothetical protein|nr:hypothetical protein [Deltaproteobacteria bacterium]MBW2537936.1 hypothetical protein [Deltaproteobacteria bacterium]